MGFTISTSCIGRDCQCCEPQPFISQHRRLLYFFILNSLYLLDPLLYIHVYFSAKEKAKNQNNPLKQIFNHCRSVQISKYLHKFNYALSRLRIYCKYNCCDSRTTCNPFCSLTKLQLLLLFTHFEKVFPFVSRNLICLYAILASSDHLQFGQYHEKPVLMKQSFALITYLEGFLALGDTSLLSLHWPWEGNVLGIYEASQQIQMGKTRAACVRGECRKKLYLLHMLTEKEATGMPRSSDWLSKWGRQGEKGKQSEILLLMSSYAYCIPIYKYGKCKELASLLVKCL